MKTMPANRIILVLGGAASGKSGLAERICCGIPGRRIYLATMDSGDRESEARIARHRRMREGKGFETVERPRDLRGLSLPPDCAAVLLEDLGNLVANEMFGGEAPSVDTAGDIWAGLRHVSAQTGTLVVVANDIFSGGDRFEGEMAVYFDSLAQVTRSLAQAAEVVVESVCGIPLVRKQKGAVVC